mmetsp:Transcript_727/g.943  ORF Transcript_727/g.943 Transcript_727/m.943 type:complete len:147 (-) Transcript_727:366-806(-)|eukprot:CAMPEP_0198138274 /NCGR_PEP_ID=MMETSP1443-20131203/1694_1 /TAXON_ID=186043 /ORGANISM="Entomoneis sp., Strain CCMP2396" /LENGTH=146 /DNA_ID=CAMNT_0043799985 /DNA_START=105 /DNA_END=545 /DNA_ORIENTATION=-
MMKLSFLLVSLFSCYMSIASAFVLMPNSHRAMSSSSSSSSSVLNLAVGPQLPAEAATTVAFSQSSAAVPSLSPLQQGAVSFAQEQQHQQLAARSTTLNVALEERKIPTPEEVEAKKRNFNIIFWGGGFVAPFLATIFYFGPKFWMR